MSPPGRLEFNGGRPGERLRLLTMEKDVAPLKTRLGCLGAILVSLVVIAGSIYSATRDIVPFLGLMALITAAAALLAGAVVFPSARLLALDCDWGASRLCYHHGLPGHPSDVGLIDFSSIGSVAVEVAPGTPRDKVTDLPIRLTVTDLEGGSLLDTRLIVSDVDCETKLMDFLMRIGQSIGLAHYHISVKNPLRFEMHVTREREDRSKTIPTITKRASYAEDVVAEGIEPPEEIAGRFDPSVTLPGGLQVAVWRPGKTVSIVKRQAVLRLFGAFGCVVLLALSAWGWRTPDSLPGPHSLRTALIPVAIAAAISAAVLVRALLYGCHLDIAAGRVRARFGLRWQEHRLSDVGEVALRHVTSGGRRQPDGGYSQSFSGYRLELGMKDGTAQPLIKEAPTNPHRSREHFDVLYPLSVALASQLGVSHRLVESAKTDPSGL